MDVFNTLVAIGTVALQVCAGILVYIAVFYNRFKETALVQGIVRYSVVVAMIVSLFGVMGSLAYSQIIGFEPCVLCWWQRVFQYPLFFIFAAAVCMKERSLKLLGYVLPMAIVGLGFSTYHYLVQRLDSVTSSCDVMGQSPSCAGYYVFEFGYVTIPMMALTIFAMTIILSFFIYKRNK